MLAACAAATLGASAQWLSTNYDFGAFDEDLGPVSCQFKYINNTDAPVTILTARASCGCTTPEFPKNAIAPGDTAIVTVKYDPAGRPGRFSKYVAVEFAPKQPKVKLIIKGTVVGSAQSIARRFPVDGPDGLKISRNAVMFGNLKKNIVSRADVDVYNRSTDTMHIAAVGKIKHLGVNIEPKTIGPGEQGKILFYFDASRCPQYGLVTDTIRLQPNPGSPVFELSSVAIVNEDFSKLTPKELAKAPVATLSVNPLDFGELTGTQPVVKTCTLKNEGKSPLKIRRFYTADPGVTLAIDRETLKPGKTAHITVTVDPTKLTGALLNARAALITNDPHNPTQNLRLTATLK